MTSVCLGRSFKVWNANHIDIPLWISYALHQRDQSRNIQSCPSNVGTHRLAIGFGFEDRTRIQHKLPNILGGLPNNPKSGNVSYTRFWRHQTPVQVDRALLGISGAQGGTQMAEANIATSNFVFITPSTLRDDVS